MSSAITNDKMDSETQMNVNDLPLEFKVCIKSVWSVVLQLKMRTYRGITVQQSPLHFLQRKFPSTYLKHTKKNLMELRRKNVCTLYEYNKCLTIYQCSSNHTCFELKIFIIIYFTSALFYFFIKSTSVL